MPPINLKTAISTSQTRHGDTARDGPLALGSMIIGIEHHDASDPKLVPPTSFFLSTTTIPSPGAGPQLR
jgi:hypothetical protein